MQNLSIGNIFASLRGRVKAVIGMVIVSLMFCVGGAASTFYLAPKQALNANRISNLPIMDAGFVSSSAAGSDILVTGYLKGDVANRDVPDFIAYTKEKWDVTITQNDEGKDNPPSGSWNLEEVVIPALTLDMNGSPVDILSSSEDIVYGEKIRDVFVDGTGSLQADYLDQKLHDGALRYQGFFDGDMATVLGKKASTGGVIPEEMFAGDRVEFEKVQKERTAIYLYGGLLLMLCSPLVLVIGGISAAFGKQK